LFYLYLLIDADRPNVVMTVNLCATFTNFDKASVIIFQ
jgi:hypothetical protein